VTEDVCAGCDFNRPDKTCLRAMEWTWRGEHFMASRSEYYQVKNQIESEQFPPAYEGGPPRYFKDLDPETQALKLKARLKGYTQKVRGFRALVV
jgi:DNA polymerase epsilon subunit 1